MGSIVSVLEQARATEGGEYILLTNSSPYIL